jgi:hypothetical protein
MRDSEQRIAQWRQSQAAAGCGPDVLDELESHLREEMRRLVLAGEPEERALEAALSRLGSPGAIAAEFAKVAPLADWLPIRLAYGLVLVLAGAACVLAGLFRGAGETPASFLLRVHVAAITFGYVTVFISGALAICYVLDRLFRGLTPGQTRSLALATRRLSSLAAVLTALGIVLGAIWAKGQWDRYWNWDNREIGGLLVLSWTLALAVLAWRRPAAVAVLMLLALLGNIVVAAAWFGPAYLDRGLHAYGQPGPIYLVGFVAAQLALVAVGLVPAGILRRQRT